MEVDNINALWELGGGVFLLLNIKEVIKHKCIRGVHIIPVIYFTFWGLWNLYYYPALDQKYSFYGSVAVVVANAIWIGFAVIYTRRERICRGKTHQKSKIT